MFKFFEKFHFFSFLILMIFKKFLLQNMYKKKFGLGFSGFLIFRFFYQILGISKLKSKNIFLGLYNSKNFFVRISKLKPKNYV